MALHQQRMLLTKPLEALRSAPLAAVPTRNLLRSLLLHSVTASPLMCKLGTKVLTANLDNLGNRGLMKWAVDKTFYAQFCAGARSGEVAATITDLRSLGYAGVILAYAREAEMSNKVVSLASQSQQIKEWLDGALKTVSYVEKGDYVAIKYSGMGLSSLPLLNEHKPCFEHPELGSALVAVCEAAKEKGVRLLVDAEQASVQDGVHRWTLNLMRRYNTGGKAVVYNTYQMYLKSSPEILCKHLEIARKDNFTLGVKLVRGAYLQSDPRHLIHDSKEDTDVAYDDAARLLLTGSPPPLQPGRRVFFTTEMGHRLGSSGEAKVNLVLATHNKRSVETALALRRQVPNTITTEIAYAQLLGMADELSLSLLTKEPSPSTETVKVFKYAVWGTTQECVKYLVRRAEENKDAVTRSAETRQACVLELRRRLMAGFRS